MDTATEGPPVQPQQQALAFIQAITANPGDDAPRLVFADWLEEQGSEPARDLADFIRVQFALADLPPDDPRQVPLQQRQRHLLHRYKHVWEEPLRQQGACDVGFRKGFVESVEIDLSDLVARAAAIQAAAPVREVRLGPFQVEEMAGNLQSLAELPILEQITSLDLMRLLDLGGEEQLGVLLGSPRLRRLTDLAIGRGGAMCRALLGSPLLPRLKRLRVIAGGILLGQELLGCEALAGLEHLELCGSVPHVSEMESLAGSPHLGQLRSLSLGDCVALTPDGVAALARARLPALRRLDLGGAGMAGQTKALARGPLLESVEELDLRQTGLHRDSIRHLARARLPRLRRLVLAGNGLDDYQIGPFAEARLGALEALLLRNNRLGDVGLHALLRAPFWPGLRHLDLSYNRIGPAGALALAAWMPPRLATLDLSWNPVGDQRAVRLVWAAPPSLAGLDLGYAEVGDSTARALTDSGVLPRLRTLLLGSNRITDHGLSALLDGLGSSSSLEALDLSNNRLTRAGVRRLLEAPALRGLGVLHLHGNDVPDELGRELRRSFRGILSWSL